MISQSSCGLTIRRCRPLERKRLPIDRPLANLCVTYSMGRDYDCELSDRMNFIGEVLRDDVVNNNNDDDDEHHCLCSMIDRTENNDDMCRCCRKRRDNFAIWRSDCDGGADLLRSISRYFSYFYDILHVTHLPCEPCDGFFGAAVDKTTRTLYLRFNEHDLAQSMFNSEAIREERVIVNDRPIPTQYASRCDKRVYSLLALCMRIERIVYESLCVLSQERTIAEMLFIDSTDLRGRCSLDKIEISRLSESSDKFCSKNEWRSSLSLNHSKSRPATTISTRSIPTAKNDISMRFANTTINDGNDDKNDYSVVSPTTFSPTTLLSMSGVEPLHPETMYSSQSKRCNHNHEEQSLAYRDATSPIFNMQELLL